MNTGEATVIKVCIIDGCDGWQKAREWCNKHYGRWRKHGTPHYVPADRSRKVCTIDGCDDWQDARGYCKKHYKRWRKHVDRDRKVCTIEGCTNWQDANARGYCKKHYKQWRKQHVAPSRVPAPSRTTPSPEVTPVTLYREVLRNLGPWYVAHVQGDAGDVLTCGEQSVCLWDVLEVYSLRRMLTTRQRLAVECVLVADMGAEDAARVVGVTPGAVTVAATEGVTRLLHHHSETKVLRPTGQVTVDSSADPLPHPASRRISTQQVETSSVQTTPESMRTNHG